MENLQARLTKAVLAIRTAVGRRFDEGASLVEYALLLGLIAIVCIAAVTFFGGATSRSFSSDASAFP